MPMGQKNPLHPSALTLKDITPGRRVLEYNIPFGVLGEFIVLEYPEAMEIVKGWGKQLVVKAKSLETGVISYRYLGDLGVIQSYGGWNASNFVIDHKKRHLLPTEPPPVSEDVLFLGGWCDTPLDQWYHDYSTFGTEE